MSKRLRFFASHLFISVIVALVGIVLVFGIWYSSPLAIATGVTHIFLMLLGVDVIVGPLFTLLVYKEHKKSLKLDLTVIIVIQILAFSYGFYHIIKGRPAWIVYSVDRFELVRAGEIYKDKKNEALPQFQKVPLLKPQYAATEFARDRELRNKDMFDDIMGGISLSTRLERYVPLAKAQNQMRERAQHLTTLQQYNKESVLQRTLVKYPQANAWLPLKANAVDMVVLINKDTAQVVKIVDLRPWN